MSVLDLANNLFAIHSLSISNDLRYSNTQIRSGACSDIKWCPYDNIFAVNKKNQTGVQENKVGSGSNQKNVGVKYSFCLNVLVIKNDGKIEVLYIIDE